MATPAKANLFLNGQRVGVVRLKGFGASWAYGDFTPEPAFAPFAPLFGAWSLVIHADEDQPALSPAASEELRRLEYAIDHLKAELRAAEDDSPIPITQISIDGPLIEWKEPPG